jgi:hypothetical protein
VLNVGDVWMKVTNFGLWGNPFTNLSNDPSGQWPGASATEYLAFGTYAVCAKNPTATEPSALRRVSYFSEWRPPTLDPEDRMYRAYDGIVGGVRFVDDDQDDKDPESLQDKIDEDFLDGRDNDGDGKIDEDYAALGQQMYSCVIRDDTQAAINSVFNEKHVPLGLETRQLAWAYSVTGLTNFNAIEWTCFNRSGHTLDSMYFEVRTDMDCGPIASTNYFTDDVDVPYAPQGDFVLPLKAPDNLIQVLPSGDTTCSRVNIRVQGYSVVDNDGDEGRTAGVPSCLLLGHTTDPLGLKAPKRVGFRSFRSYVAGTPYSSNGNPAIDQERYELAAKPGAVPGHGEGINDRGFIDSPPGDQDGDYQAIWTVGPFLQVPDGGSIQLTIAFAVERGDFQSLQNYAARYSAAEKIPMKVAGDDVESVVDGSDLFNTYPILKNAFEAQVAYEGKYEPPRPGFEDKVRLLRRRDSAAPARRADADQRRGELPGPRVQSDPPGDGQRVHLVRLRLRPLHRRLGRGEPRVLPAPLGGRVAAAESQPEHRVELQLFGQPHARGGGRRQQGHAGVGQPVGDHRGSQEPQVRLRVLPGVEGGRMAPPGRLRGSQRRGLAAARRVRRP